MKLCKDCKWAERADIVSAFSTGELVRDSAYCTHPDAPRSPVTGEPDTMAKTMRQLYGQCGRPGDLWEPRNG
jgi:hypothetical protein